MSWTLYSDSTTYQPLTVFGWRQTCDLRWASIVWAVIGSQVHRSICSVTGLALVQVALHLQCHSHTETLGPAVTTLEAAPTLAAATAMAQEVQGIDQVVEAVVMVLVAVERKGPTTGPLHSDSRS
jgi:hypothetical protein